MSGGHSPARVRCSISGIAYQLGEVRDLEDLDWSGELHGLSTAQAWGMRRCSVSSASEGELAQTSLAKTIRARDVDPASVQAVVYATSHLKGDDYAEIHRHLGVLGLQRADAVGVSLGGCNNAATALRVAASLVQSEQLDRILVTCVERCRLASRLLPGGHCVLSDGAVSCLVERAGRGEWDLTGMVVTNDAVMAGRGEAPDTKWTLMMMANLRRTVRKLLRQIDRGQHEVERVIFNNYSEALTRSLLTVCGLDPDKGYYDNIARMGHVFAADSFINLKDALDDRPLNPGALVLVAGTSPASCAVMSFEAAAGRR